MKLKTLKDLQLEYTGDIARLKAEAIKWVKHFRKLKLKSDRYRAEILMNFCNITEEELI